MIFCWRRKGLEIATRPITWQRTATNSDCTPPWKRLELVKWELRKLYNVPVLTGHVIDSSAESTAALKQEQQLSSDPVEAADARATVSDGFRIESLSSLISGPQKDSKKFRKHMRARSQLSKLNWRLRLYVSQPPEQRGVLISSPRLKRLKSATSANTSSCSLHGMIWVLGW